MPHPSAQHLQSFPQMDIYQWDAQTYSFTVHFLTQFFSRDQILNLCLIFWDQTIHYNISYSTQQMLPCFLRKVRMSHSSLTTSLQQPRASQYIAWWNMGSSFYTLESTFTAISSLIFTTNTARHYCRWGNEDYKTVWSRFHSSEVAGFLDWVLSSRPNLYAGPSSAKNINRIF